jgi:integrase
MGHNHTIIVFPDTIVQAADSYYLSVTASGLQPHTIELYQHAIKKLIKYMLTINVKTIDQLTPDNLRSFFILLKENHNTGGVHLFYRSIKAFLRWVWDEFEFETRNPIERVKVEPAKVIARPGIPLESIEKMISSCKSEFRIRDKALLLCLLDSAARATEFCNLTMADVDLITGQVHIVVGKGGKSRHVRFAERSLRMLRRYLKTRGALYATSPLFATYTNEKFDRFSLRLLVDRRADNANVPHAGLHDFRRRCAYEMLRAGVPTKMISEYLGHSSVAVTERYLAVVVDDLMAAHKIASPSNHLKL